MGKVRVKVLGDEEAEKKQQKKAAQKKVLRQAQDKKAEEVEELKVSKVLDVSEVSKEETKELKTETRKPETRNLKTDTKKSRSKKYQAAATHVDKNKIYDVGEAAALLPKLSISDFDETVELHMNMVAMSISGQLSLPHGTGKKVRVAIASDEIISEIEKGQINFDILIAEPSQMPKLAKVARVLGPRGLMPNPKNGTVTPNPEEAAKKYEGGVTNFKTEAKFPLLHISIGKVSFGPEKIQANIASALKTIQIKNIKSATLKSTMSPGIRLDVTTA